MEGQSEESETKRVLTRSNVQGVFFRSSLKNLADSLKVRGWTRNLSDVSVNAFLQGRPDNVAKVVEWCRSSSKKARVQNVSVFLVNDVERFTSLQSC